MGKLNVILVVTRGRQIVYAILLALLGEMTLIKESVHVLTAMNLESLSAKSDKGLIDFCNILRSRGVADQ